MPQAIALCSIADLVRRFTVDSVRTWRCIVELFLELLDWDLLAAPPVGSAAGATEPLSGSYFSRHGAREFWPEEFEAE